MKNNSRFNELSYLKAASKSEALAGKPLDFIQKVFDEASMGVWRHKRVCSVIDPILEAEPEALWVTVGDGRWGRDAKYILDKGGSALATNISDATLKEASDLGYINAYQQENAEALSFDADAFDYVLCKEAYHHFPRPMIALYEMLRVASRAVVLIEPNDRFVNNNLMEALFSYLINNVFKIEARHQFEKEAGNYKYAISKREIEKTAVALNCKSLFFKGINDSSIRGLGRERFSRKSRLYKKYRNKKLLLDVLAKIRCRRHGKLVAVIFKAAPSKAVVEKFRRQGFEFIELPQNPYIKSSAHE